MKRKLYQHFASRLLAMINCETSENIEWRDKHREVIEILCKQYMPSGGGFDAGTSFDFDKSTPNRLRFNTSFHHMDEAGGYNGWTDHTVTVTPSLAMDYELSVSGRNKNDVKDYIADVFSIALSNLDDLFERMPDGKVELKRTEGVSK